MASSSTTRMVKLFTAASLIWPPSLSPSYAGCQASQAQLRPRRARRSIFPAVVLVVGSLRRRGPAKADAEPLGLKLQLVGLALGDHAGLAFQQYAVLLQMDRQPVACALQPVAAEHDAAVGLDV